jgi:hypothetical protein
MLRCSLSDKLQPRANIQPFSASITLSRCRQLTSTVLYSTVLARRPHSNPPAANHGLRYSSRYPIPHGFRFHGQRATRHERRGARMPPPSSIYGLFRQSCPSIPSNDSFPLLFCVLRSSHLSPSSFILVRFGAVAMVLAVILAVNAFYRLI